LVTLFPSRERKRLVLKNAPEDLSTLGEMLVAKNILPYFMMGT
jgi:hypothetical protein